MSCHHPNFERRKADCVNVKRESITDSKKGGAVKPSVTTCEGGVNRKRETKPLGNEKRNAEQEVSNVERYHGRVSKVQPAMTAHLTE